MVQVAGLWGFGFRTVFLLSMAALMFSGRALCLLHILPGGMLRLSAASIKFVCILLPWCASVDSGVFVSVCYISFVKSFPVCFLVVCV